MRLPAAERRAQLLEVATAVFATNGYHTASMNDIADAAGVTKPVLYQHFASKRALYLELITDIGERLQTAIAAATAEADGPRNRVERGFSAYFDYVAENPDAFRLLFGTGTRRDAEFAQKARSVERAISSAIAELIDIDGATVEQRQLLAMGIVGIAEVTCRNWESDGRTVPTNVLSEQVAELAWFGLRGVRPRGG